MKIFNLSTVPCISCEYYSLGRFKIPYCIFRHEPIDDEHPSCVIDKNALTGNLLIEDGDEHE